jgi:sulfite reductase (NADPH) flavoprotein alpha-component
MSKHTAKLVDRRYLTPSDVEKKTLHLEILFDKPVAYLPGDSIAIDVLNPPSRVEKWLKKFDRSGSERIEHKRTKEEIDLYSYLLEHVNLQSVQEGDLSQARPLMPRFYSIASSSSIFPNQIHLLVTLDEFIDEEGEKTMGVGSHYLANYLSLHDTCRFKVFPNELFRLPEPTTPIIMIGPGTGLAPFKAFLEERIYQNAPAKNWLLFGERNRRSHFYYEDFLVGLSETGQLDLSLAFSRDQDKKIYVQDRLRENKEKLFSYLEEGASIYICGDAKVMAKGVTETLEDLYRDKMGVSVDEARDWLRRLKGEKRLHLDVY